MLIENAKIESEKIQLQSKCFELELNLKRMMDEISFLKEQNSKQFSDEKRLK